nr:phasin family protein [uncultured Halomonas sp.]
MANTNVNENVEQAQQQFANVFAGPARSIASKMIDYTQKIASVQREAFDTYSEIGFGQMRSALEVRNSEDLRSYMEEQQEAAKKVSEQMKSDMEKVSSINQEFMQQSQEVTQDAMQRGQKVAQQNMERGQQKLQEVAKEGEKEVDKAAQEAKSTSKK